MRGDRAGCRHWLVVGVSGSVIQHSEIVKCKFDNVVVVGLCVKQVKSGSSRRGQWTYREYIEIGVEIQHDGDVLVSGCLG
jgi:hypothetical protein